MAFTLPCPRGEECPIEAEECFEFSTQTDSDDSGRGPWVLAEFEKQHCPCSLNDVEVASMMVVADKRALEDYLNYEPPGL